MAKIGRKPHRLARYFLTQQFGSLALAVDDGGTMLVVLGLGDPASTEGAERGERGGTLPDGVLAVGSGNNPDLGTGGGESLELLLQALGNTSVHGGTARKDDVLAEIFADIDVGGGDRFPSEGMERLARLTVELGLEDELGGLHAELTGDGNLALIGELVNLIELGAALSGGSLLIVVEGDEADLLLDGLDDFELSGRGEGLADLEEQLLGVVGKDATSDLHLLDSVGNGEALEDGDSVGNTITGVDDETSGATSGVERHDSLNSNVSVLNLEGLEHLSDHLLTVRFRVARSLSDENTLDLSGVGTELVEEGVVPDSLHVIPIVDDTSLDGVLQVENTSLLVSLVTDEKVLLVDALHGRLILRATNNRGEDSTRSFLASKASLHHTGTVVDNDNLLFSVFNHCFYLVSISRFVFTSCLILIMIFGALARLLYDVPDAKLIRIRRA